MPFRVPGPVEPARAERAGDPEVGELHLALEGDEDVLGRHVPVDEPGRAPFRHGPVGVGERASHLVGDVHGARQAEAHVQLAATVEHRAQALPVDELHGDGVAPLDEIEPEDVDDAGVVERGGHLGLLDEHAHHLVVVAAVGAHELHRHLLHEARRTRHLGTPHLGHAARGDGLDEEVFAELAHGPRS